MPLPEEFALDELTLRAALDLDQEERAYLASLDLAATWRVRSNSVAESAWGWLAFLVVVAAFIGWTVAAQPFGDLLATANQVGLNTILVSTALRLLLGLGQLLIDFTTSPVLALSQPLLIVLALALLFWPRMTSAPHYLQGVRS